jgi:hypothetical protein
MARINLLDTRTTSFGDLISNGKLYRVPPFQRDYSWMEENWEDLWLDILTLHTNSDARVCFKTLRGRWGILEMPNSASLDDPTTASTR